MNPGFTYVLDYFRKLYNIPAGIKIGYGCSDSKINIQMGEIEYFNKLEPYPVENVVWQQWNGTKIPFLFDNRNKKPILEVVDSKVFINYDILASSFFFLSGWQEYVYLSIYPSLRYPYRESLQKKLKITKIPVVNYYFDILKEAIQTVYHIDPDIQIFGKNRSAICLTHDIDKCNSGWKEGGLFELKNGRPFSFVKLCKKRLFNNDVWFNLDEIINIEKKFKTNSSFYFLPKKGKTKTEIVNQIQNKLQTSEPGIKSDQKKKPVLKTLRYNADYDLRSPKFREVINKIQDSGSEIGLHGSFGTALDLELLKQDLEGLNVPVAGIRFHNLLLDITRTYGILQQAGLKYDTTSGFAEEIGFRNGITFPFYPFDFRNNKPFEVLEIPLMIMDTTFRNYNNTPIDQVFSQIIEVLDQSQKFNGLMTILWHNNYFSPYKFAGWREIYEQILSEAVNRNIRLINARQVYKSMF